MKPSVCLLVAVVLPLSLCRSALAVIYIYTLDMYIILIILTKVAGAVFGVICGRCSLSHACRCKQNSRQFCSAFWSLFQIFCQAKTFIYEPNFATFLVISTFDILLNVLDDFHVFFVSFFC